MDFDSEAVTPGGRPVQERLTAESKMPLCALVTLSWAVEPAVTVNALWAAVKPKLDADTATVMGTLVVKLPLAAVKERLKVLAGMLSGVVI